MLSSTLNIEGWQHYIYPMTVNKIKLTILFSLLTGEGIRVSNYL